MAGGRRTAKSSAFKHHAHSSDDRHNCEVPAPQQVIPPKHIPIPDLPSCNELCFEAEIVLFCILAMGGQYLNLYRSVFWLPYSHNVYAMNFYLIDLYVIIFNLVVVTRRFPFYLLKQLCFLCLPTSIHQGCLQCIKILSAIIYIPVIVWCSYNIFIRHGTLSIFCLGYPSIVYIIMFGPTASQILELKNVAPEKVVISKNKGTLSKTPIFNVNHVCSMSAETVREEVETLKTDFNCRLKHVLFNSLLVAYYLSFVPCCFTPNALYYDTYWVGQYIILTWLSSFIMHVTYCFPTRYCDILHRSALHLGRWQKVDMKNLHVPYSMWSESTMWSQGALVKHSKELFKAEGLANAAEPGNATQSRFYAFFNNPSVPLGCIFVLQVLLTAFLLILALISADWHDLLSVVLLLLVNCRPLYKMTRNCVVLARIYKEEKALLIKCSN